MHDATLNRPALVAGLIGLLALGALTRPAGAQSCSVEETIAACWERLSSQASEVSTANAATAADTETTAANSTAAAVKGANAGVDTAAASTASATKNFIPLLRFAGLVGDGVTTEDGLIAFDVNFPFPVPGDGNRSQLQLIANPSPQLYTPLDDALTTLGNDPLRAELENDVSDTDDLRIAFTYGKKGENLGRDFEQYRAMFSSLVNGAFLGREDPDLERFGALIAEATATLSAAQPELASDDGIEGVTFREISDNAFRTRLMGDIAAAATQELATTESLQTRLREFELQQFAKLVANQPQLYVKAEQRLGDTLIGPDQTSLVVTWERGFASLTSFARDAGAGCTIAEIAAQANAPENCLTAFQKYVRANRVDIEKGSRMALSLEYSKVDDYTFDRPQDALAVTVPSTNKIAASYTFGRSIAADRAEGQRIDFVLKYEDSDDNNVLNDRTIAGFTYSRKVGDSVFPVTLLYSTEGEMAGDDGDELTVNFGMAFEMIK